MLTYATLPSPENLKPLNLALILESAQAQFYDDLLLRLSDGGQSSTGAQIPGLHLPPQSTASVESPIPEPVRSPSAQIDFAIRSAVGHAH